LIPAFARHAVYLAKAAEFCPPPNPPARGAPDTAGLGAGFEVALVAAFAGKTLIPANARAATAIADFLKVEVMV